mmetsp:Transcript_21132/g.60598  ORF Transcript_21132/g.60598 Transcript_21132/m.60598 type:complete len:1143 (+) Transcript_21132:1-3429(+)
MPPGTSTNEGAAGRGSSSPIPSSASSRPQRPSLQSHHSAHVFTATGQVMTQAQRSEYCHRRGLCEGCGVRTHDIHGLGLIVSRPVTSENVHSGICKRCHPGKARTAMESDGIDLEADDNHMLVLATTSSSLAAAVIAEEVAANNQQEEGMGDEYLNMEYIHRRSSAGAGNGSSGVNDSGSSGGVGAEHTGSRTRSGRVSFLSSGTSSGGKLRASFLSNDSSTADAVDGAVDGDADGAESDIQSSTLQDSKSSGGNKRRFAKKLWKKAKLISMIAVPTGTSSAPSKSLANSSSTSLALEEVVVDESGLDANRSTALEAQVQVVEGADISGKTADSSGQSFEGDEKVEKVEETLSTIDSKVEAIHMLKGRAGDANAIIYALRELTRIIEDGCNDDQEETIDTDDNVCSSIEVGDGVVSESNAELEQIPNTKQEETTGPNSTITDASLLDALVVALQEHTDCEEILKETSEVLLSTTKERIKCGCASVENRDSLWQSPYYEAIIGVLADRGSVAVQERVLLSLVLVLDHLHTRLDDENVETYLRILDSMNMWKRCSRMLWDDSVAVRVKELSLCLLISLDGVGSLSGANLDILVIASNVLRKYPGSATLQSMAVPYLAGALPTSEDMIVEGDGLKKIVQVLEIHGKDDTCLQQAALSILLNTSDTPSYWVNDPGLIQKAMRVTTDISDDELSILQCDVLSNLLLLPNGREIAIIQSERIPKVLHQLLDSTSCQSISRLLSNTFISNPSQAWVFAEAGAVGVLSAVIASSNKELGPKCSALDTLYHLLANLGADDIENYMDNALIEHLLVSMRGENHIEEQDRVKVFRFVNHLIMSECKVPYEKFLSEMCSVIQRSRNPSIQEQCCRIIHNIAVAARKADALISPIELFCVLLELIDSNSTLDIVQKEACGAIHTLIVNSQEDIDLDLLEPVSTHLFGSVLEEKNGIDEKSIDILEEALAIVDVITERTVTSGETLSFTPDQIEVLVSLAFFAFDSDIPCEGVVATIMNIFQCVSCDETTAGALVEGGGIITIIDALQAFPEEIDIQILGCSIIARLCVESLQVQFACVESNGIETILGGMARFQKNKGLQSNACHAIAHLSVDEEARERMAAAGGLGIIASVKESFPEDEDLQNDASYLLKWLVG